MLRHHLIDLCVGWLGVTMEKRRGFHDHARLAEPALRNVFLHPGCLAGMA
jgi:hypothetical protein